MIDHEAQQEKEAEVQYAGAAEVQLVVEEVKAGVRSGNEAEVLQEEAEALRVDSAEVLQEEVEALFASEVQVGVLQLGGVVRIQEEVEAEAEALFVNEVVVLFGKEARAHYEITLEGQLQDHLLQRKKKRKNQKRLGRNMIA